MNDALTRQYRQSHEFSDDWIAAQIEALDAAGYVIVPKKPTDFMSQHGANGYLGMDDSVAADIWQRMIRAAKP